MERFDASRAAHQEALIAAKGAPEAQRPDFDTQYEGRHVLIGPDLVYLPDQSGAVGSLGLLVVRLSGQIIRLGSYTSIPNFVWAYYRGIDLVGQTGDQRTNTLTINTVHKKVETL